MMGGLLHLVQRGRAWAGCGTAQSPLAVPNVTAHTHHGQHHFNFSLDVELYIIASVL